MMQMQCAMVKSICLGTGRLNIMTMYFHFYVLCGKSIPECQYDLHHLILTSACCKTQKG